MLYRTFEAILGVEKRSNEVWTEDFILKMIGVAGAGGLLSLVVWGLVIKPILDVRKEIRASRLIIYRRDTPEWQKWAEEQQQKREKIEE